MPYLRRRWREGCTDSMQLWREIQTQGYGHSTWTVSRFVTRLRRAAEDLAAVTAGLTRPWSQGPVEGQITRLKLLKRQSYGRAGFTLLRQRLLQAGSSGTRRPRALRARLLGRGQRAAA
jgi:hypothetical protein